MPFPTPARPRTPAVLAVLALVFAGLVAAAQPARAAGPVPIVVGTPTPVTLATEGDVAELTFTAPADRSIVVAGSGSTFPDGAYLQLLDADGGFVNSGSVGGWTGDVADLGVTTAQAYTLRVSAWGSGTGSVTIRLDLVARASGTLTPDTPATRVIAPGQTVDLTFTGRAGARPRLLLSAASLTSGGLRANAHAQLLRPDGSAFDLTGLFVDEPQPWERWWEGSEQLDATGTWTLRLDPAGDTGGSVTFTLFLVTDVAGTATVGTPTTLDLTTGQDAELAFTPVAGRRITVRVLSSTLDGETTTDRRPAIGLRRPDGSWVDLGESYDRTFRETDQPADTGGTWVLRVNPVQDVHGSLELVIGQPADVTVTPSFTGPTPVALPDPGVNAVLPFTAAEGQRLTVGEAGATWTRADYDGSRIPGRVVFKLLPPDGGEPIWFETVEGFGESRPLPASGGWTLVVDPEADTTGSATLTLGFGRDIGGPIPLDTPTTVSFAPGEVARYTFSGVAGRLPNVSVTASEWGAPYPGVRTSLLRPDGSYFTDVESSGTYGGPGTYAEARRPLDVTGTWTLVIDPPGGVSGWQTFVFRQPVDVTGRITSGTSRTVTLGTPGQKAVFTYTAAVGQRPVVQVTDQSWSSVTDAGLPAPIEAIFQGPGASPEESTRVYLGTSPRDFFEGPVADVAGTWTVTIDPQRDTVGHLTGTPRLIRDTTGTLTPNSAKTISLGTPGQNTRLTFPGTAGQRFGIDLRKASWTSKASSDGTGSMQLRLISPGGWQVGQTMQVIAGEVPTWVELDPSRQTSTLTETGTWALELDPYSDTVGSTTFTVHTRTDQTADVTLGRPRKVTITAKGQDAVLDVPVHEGKELRYRITGSTFAAATVGDDMAVQFGSGLQVPKGAGSGVLGQSWSAEPRRIRINPVAGATGSLTITFTEVG